MCVHNPFFWNRVLTSEKSSEVENLKPRNMSNKTGTFKVGAISKAQKAQDFLKKKLEIFDFFSLRKCRIVPKNVKGGTL